MFKNGYQTNQYIYKKRIRQANNSRKRQALFIAEYVQTKYNDIYIEAAELYNHINQIYPKKPDLTRSDEFRNWKLIQKGRSKIKPHNPGTYSDLKWPYQGIVIQHKEIIEDTNVQDKETIEEIVARVPKKTLQLTIPLISAQHIHQLNHDQDSDQATDKNGQDSDQATIENGQDSDQATNENGQESDQATNENGQDSDQATDKNGQDSDQATDKNGQDSDQATNENGQDLGDWRQASDEFDEIQPSIFDHSSDKVITEIMEQLRGDPDISRLMDDIDMEYQFDDLDIGMEIELQDPLEEEMQSIM